MIVIQVMPSLAPILTPHGKLTLGSVEDAPALEAELSARLQKAFARGSGHGLLQLGAGEVDAALPAVFTYWRAFGARYVTHLCAMPNVQEAKFSVPPPTDAELEQLAEAAPLMTGAEYLDANVLAELWQAMDQAFALERTEAGLAVQDFLKRLHPAWNLVGRVYFNLAENRKDDAAPFAFLATYTTQLSANARAQHVPLGQALREYAGAANRERLLSLLQPVQAAVEVCPWLKAMVDNGEIFHPLRWGPREAFRFLNDAANLERAGVVVRMPATWRMNRPARPQVRATIGGKRPSRLGLDALLDFRMEVALDGVTLSPAEVRQLLAQSEGLALIRGRWIEVDHARLQRTLTRFQDIARAAKSEGLSFGEAMRLLAGTGIAGDGTGAAALADWSQLVAGPWLAEILKGLRSPETSAQADPGKALRGTLRPYQRAGVRWLHLLASLGLGACLADDMGLGKTIQVLSLLLVLKHQSKPKPTPSLLVAPASLLANWRAELERFAPGLTAFVAHPSSIPAAELKKLALDHRPDLDLVITSYGSLERVPSLNTTAWRLVILDEAQAIKNPGTKQTKAVKRLKAQSRIALTGTPIENRLGDLWSIFDFINPGLLGSAKQFSRFVKNLGDGSENPYAPLRELVRPYLLRRLKTDKRIITDLPDKTEIKAFCALSRRQVALYQQAVDDLSCQLAEADGIRRKGLVLALLMRLKQICNHPSQWLGDGAWSETDSGKLTRLRELADVIAAKQEKALVFTQFREITEPLASFLGSVFGRPGLVLHGATEVRKRKDLVARFQDDESVPFFVLSLKAGGAGLNLTAASHVIHFDRWWNPAVENQATDRAFRIGQTKNVLVHKFICQGTVEDKIDRLMMSKQQLAGDLLGGGVEARLTEMQDEELLKLVSLDLNAALKEA